VANRLGAAWDYKHPGDVMHECARLTPMFAGVTYERLEGYKSLQWPVAADGTDQPLLYTKEFPLPGGKAQLYPLEWKPPCEEVNAEYNLHLNNGRLLEHFHEGNMTYRVAGIREEVPRQFLEISPELAQELQIADGRWIEVKSRHGMVRVPVLVTDRVQGKELYLPLNSSVSSVNVLSSSHIDPFVHTPAYKEIAVKLRVLPDKGPSPLPRSNHRFAQPTPQRGVEVERKWKRKDYRLPGSQLVQIQSNGRNGHG
jgi:formate dehydrogenase major subunit